mmetsp:Transcript_33937/g.49693  ORF Transcript_33937/g.49693 Transcript_33937/m.49693 type:complete len:818 (-) Transcript_33937:246-2699(-)
MKRVVLLQQQQLKQSKQLGSICRLLDYPSTHRHRRPCHPIQNQNLNGDGSFATSQTFFLTTDSKCKTRAYSSQLQARNLSSTSSQQQQQQQQPQPKLVKQEVFTDFFGEPITFLSPHPSSSIPSPVEALAIMDFYIQGTTSKGLANTKRTKGGDEYGLSTLAAHSTALTAVEALQMATLWNDKNGSSCPMLVAAVISPIIATAGLGYLQRLDTLLQSTSAHFSPNTTPTIPILHPPLAPLQLLPLAQNTISEHLSSSVLTPREKHHLQTLDYLLQEKYDCAIEELQMLLITCPGDALALSMIMDLCTLTGNCKAAHWAASSVASYWSERTSSRLGDGRTSQPGHTIGTSLISVGFALSHQNNTSQTAESLAESSLHTHDTTLFSDSGSFCAGVASASLASLYEMQGRSSEGLSLCGGYDGVQRFNQCGYMYHDCILGGFYGGVFALDKDGAGAGRTALRIYDEYFGERIIRYCVRDSATVAVAGSGSKEQALSMLECMKAPINTRKEMVGKALSTPKSMFQSFFGGNDDRNSNNKKDGDMEQAKETIISSSNNHSRSAEDVLCWLPPTQQLLTSATLLLLRLTLNGSITQDDQRWIDLRNVWIDLIESEIEVVATTATTMEEKKNRALFPMAFIASSLLLDHDDVSDFSDDGDDSAITELSRGLCLMGRLMCLGHHHHHQQQQTHAQEEEGTASYERNENEEMTLEQKQWSNVVQHFISAKTKANTGSTSKLLNHSPQLLRPIMEHALCHAAVLSNKYEHLCYARAVCSESVTLRSNCPEVWFRYSVILERLGDYVAAEDAKATSISLGSGEGGFVG